MPVRLRTKSTLVRLYGVAVLLIVALPLVAGQCAQNCICLRPTTICDGNPNQNLGSVERLTEIDPNSFINGDFVITLNLSSNAPLQLFSGSFNGLTNLQTLNLSSNGLRSPLPVALFQPLQSLQELDLSNNALSSLPPSSLLGLNNLTTLRLGGNRLSIIPPSLVTDLPALTTITLHSNLWDCNDDNITVLFQLVQSGLVTDGNQVRCTNSTLVRDLDIPVEVPTTTILPTSSFQITTTTILPTSSFQITTTTILPTTSFQITSSPAISPTSRVIPTPTPPPPARPCSSQTTLTLKGYFDWPTTHAGNNASVTCPYGPLEQVATRVCMASGLWGEVEDGECMTAQTTQLLTQISQNEITMVTSVEISFLLASLPPSSPLTLQELQTLTDIATQLVDTSGSNIQVINNTLVALNTMLNSSGSILSNNTALTHRLRDLIDTILLDALSANDTQLVLAFSGLAVGGAYIPDTNHTHILATIRLNGGRVGVVIGEGGGNGGDVEVDVNGAPKGDIIQVTVYEGTDLFNEGACNNPPTLTTPSTGYTREGGEGVKGGEVVTPVISVTHKVDGEEVFTLTFNNVQTRPGDSVLCARWNNTLNCGGGGWQTEGCQLIYSGGSTFRCQCLDEGTFSVIDIPGEPSDGLPYISRVLFYVFCSLTAPSYLTVAFTILVHKHLRTTPTMQCLVALSVSQGFSLAVTAISFEAPRGMQALCYSLGVTQHYLILLALAWLCVYPVLMVIRVFRRMWYEKEWLIAPFAAFCIAIPGIPVAVYGGVRYGTFPEQPDTCWFEGALFPNYFTYISGFVTLTAVTLILGSMVLLKCSDYTVDSSAFRQLVSLLGNLVFYFATILCQFFTPTAQDTSDHLLIVTGMLAFLCSLYFFITNGLGKGRIRSAILCRDDPILKAKLTNFKHNSSSFPSSNQNSRSSLHKFRRSPTRLVDEMNINYVDSYLGYPHTNPVPLAMLNQVQHAQGRRVKGDRKSGEIGYKNSAYQVAEGYTEV